MGRWKIGTVATVTEGWGFNITDERDRPLVVFAYETHGEAVVAAGGFRPAEQAGLAAAGVVGDLLGLSAVVAAEDEIASAPLGRHVSNRLHDQLPCIQCGGSRELPRCSKASTGEA